MLRKVKQIPIGESIDNRIKDYDIVSRKVFLRQYQQSIKRYTINIIHLLEVSVKIHDTEIKN